MRVLLAGVMVLCALLVSAEAWPCGGMLFKNHEQRPGGMSDQQVLVATSPEETVLTVSVGYSGAAGDFAFLFPLQKVPSSVVDGDQGLFAALEENTAPRVIVEDGTAPVDSGGGGCGCFGGGAKAGARSPEGQAPGVVVHDRGQTQTYEYAVIGGSDSGSVSEWLTKEGFQAPAAFQAALDRYLGARWVFLAAKLKADAAQGNLAPLEMHLPAVSLETLSYPFGMSADSLAPGKRVTVTLYLLSAQGMLPVDYPVERIHPVELKALSATSSNYEEVFARHAEEGAMVLEYGTDSFSLAALGGADALRKLLGDKATLVRLRAALRADQLKDAGFRPAETPELRQENVFYVQWKGGTRQASAWLGLWLVGAALLARRRW